MKIYIPSRARADQRNHTFEQLPIVLQDRATMVVGPDDYADYCERFGKAHVMKVDATGIGPVRQSIVDRHYRASRKAEDARFVMMDDDLVFFIRRQDDLTKFQKATHAQIGKMFLELEKQLDKRAHASVSPRENANHNPARYVENTRMLRVLGYDVDVLHDWKVRYDRVPVMEDFDVTLQLLRLGFDNIVLNHYIQNQAASNAPGGCSTYRSMELQAEGARGLAALHPDFVTVVEKDPPKSGAWSGQPRLDVRIQWKKARSSADAR